ncbi:nucleolar rRNA processing protein, putative [Plasmodium ovale]|uniref:U3 small nucleolar RNA-associated protein 11 n=1 Tax=Plasmodium ovale TaxID=36330 RepID=A0A1C3L609_PLAOA|nr:nucleolar rRNA processing protein, putative [Plasmodium ovale]
MSSLKNVVPKRSYLERGQAKNRLHLGELEKKVDYEKRREIYKKKKRIENVLKEKIMNKNPDEFHTGMVHSRIREDDNVLVKEEKIYNDAKIMEYERKKIKNTTFNLYGLLKRVNRKIYNMQMNIPLRYIFNNTHEIYNENEEKCTLKADKKKLQKEGILFENKFKNMLTHKSNILKQIRNMDNSYIKTYRHVDGYTVQKHKGKNSTYKLFAPRLR